MRRMSVLTLLVVVLAVALAAVSSPAGRAATEPPAAQSCVDHGVNPTFGSNVPYKSAQWIDNKCYCGAKDGVTPKQAQAAGWYASCNNGQCICNFAAGTIASNACCMPPKPKS